MFSNISLSSRVSPYFPAQPHSKNSKVNTPSIHFAGLNKKDIANSIKDSKFIKSIQVKMENHNRKSQVNKIAKLESALNKLGTKEQNETVEQTKNKQKLWGKERKSFLKLPDDFTLTSSEFAENKCQIDLALRALKKHIDSINSSNVVDAQPVYDKLKGIYDRSNSVDTTA